MELESLHQVIHLQNQRQENMDRYLVERRVLDGVLLRLYSVCDGVGSTPRGGAVAEDVVSSLWEWFYALDSVQGIEEALVSHMRGLNERLFFREREENLSRGATTASILLLVEDGFFLFHLGDSRIFARESERWLQLTEDQVMMGALTQCLPMEQISPQCWGNPQGFSHFLLATDGLYRRLDWSSLELELPFFRKNGQFLSDLAEDVVSKGERDNITGIFIWNEYRGNG